MRKTCLSLAAIAMLCSCTKKETVVNNYLGNMTPPFSIEGLQDLTIVNNESPNAMLGITVQYQDSAQERVTLDFEGLPTGISIDTPWQNYGYPTFNTNVVFKSSTVGALPGAYKITLTATSASGVVKSYPFNLLVKPMSTVFLGKYNTCTSSCLSGFVCADSLYQDAADGNKIWFNNFLNSGEKLYGIVSNTSGMVIPEQIINGIHISGTGSINPEYHGNIVIAYTANGESCSLNMN